MTIWKDGKRLSSKEEKKIRTDRGDSPSIIKTTVERTERRERKNSSTNKEEDKTYKPQTQSTIDKLKSGEIKTKENVYTVGGEVTIGERTAQAVAEYKRQEAEKRYKKRKAEFMEDTRERLTTEWDRKKEKALEEKFIKGWEEKREKENVYFQGKPLSIPKETEAYKVTNRSPKNPEYYFTPDRYKSPQESMDVTTSVDLKQYMKLDNTIPKEFETKDTFRDVEQISKEALRQSKQGSFLAHWGMYIDYTEQELLKGTEQKTKKGSEAVQEMISLSGSSETISPQEFKTNLDIQTDTLKQNQLSIKESANVLIAPAVFGVARGGKNVVYGVTHPKRLLKVW